MKKEQPREKRYELTIAVYKNDEFKKNKKVTTAPITRVPQKGETAIKFNTKETIVSVREVNPNFLEQAMNKKNLIITEYRIITPDGTVLSTKSKKEYLSKLDELSLQPGTLKIELKGTRKEPIKQPSHIENQIEEEEQEDLLWDDDDDEIIGYECLACGNVQANCNGFGCDRCTSNALDPIYN